MKTHNHSSSRGFSIVELLIVAAIIGLITAIAIPNLLNAIQRSRQTRTVSDMRGISNGIAMYQQDFAKFPVASSYVAVEDLRPDLAPFIGDGMVTVDAWQRSFYYKSNGDFYTLVSYALDGTATEPWTEGITTLFEDDIVIVDGNFLQIPQGAQN
ncbi:MAG: type II secretion system protein GspG [Thermoanaerobaculales bacterium]|nr:type II secretion system protein GspG [Thermoanaerobaculales bacterium]